MSAIHGCVISIGGWEIVAGEVVVGDKGSSGSLQMRGERERKREGGGGNLSVIVWKGY